MSEALVMELVSGAGSKVHLQREKALARLEESLMREEGVAQDVAFWENIYTGVRNLVRSEHWEGRLGGIRLAKVLLSYRVEEPFATQMLQACDDLLEDGEVRVRWAVGELLHTLAERQGVGVWEHMRGPILDSIHNNFDRDKVEPSSVPPSSTPGASPAPSVDGGSPRGGAGALTRNLSGASLGGYSSGEGEGGWGWGAYGTNGGGAAAAGGYSSGEEFLSSLLQRSYRIERPGTGDLRHGTEGWKCLETSVRALQHVMQGTGPAFAPHLDETLLQLIFKCVSHPNRFVREAAHLSLITVSKLLEGPRLEGEQGPEIARRLVLGLCDNWSQVRYAASVATRSLLKHTGPEARERQLLPILLPAMCLNRYYVAEGVRNYSQETWRRVMGTHGRDHVAKHAQQVVSFYVEQAKANNHSVREAACACMAELMAKVDRSAVAPHVPRLLRSLVGCFKDPSWPVLGELYPLWFAHVRDVIPSVRQDAAAALGDAVRAYGDEALEHILPQLRELLPMAKQQPSESKELAGVEGSALFGVAAQRARDNDVALHTDQTMYSCGSLMANKRGADCCFDGTTSREQQAWEASDGAVYMLRVLAEVAPQHVAQFLPTLAEVARLTHFVHAPNLQETVWRQLPAIAEGMGVKAFKPHLDEFLEPLLRGLVCGHRACEVAAGQCAGKLRDLIGPGIFSGRLTEEQRQLMAGSQDVPPPQGKYVLPGGGAAVTAQRRPQGVV
ncbi:hypothetical protein N2152v2_005501 [Parachlorella kessleri]